MKTWIAVVLSVVLAVSLPCFGAGKWLALEIALKKGESGAWEKVLSELDQFRDKLPKEFVEQNAFRRILRMVVASMNNATVRSNVPSIISNNVDLARLMPEIGMLASAWGLQQINVDNKAARGSLKIAKGMLGQHEGAALARAETELRLVILDIAEKGVDIEQRRKYAKRLDRAMKLALRIFVEHGEEFEYGNDPKRLFVEQDLKRADLMRFLSLLRLIQVQSRLPSDATTRLLDTLKDVKNEKSTRGEATLGVGAKRTVDSDRKNAIDVDDLLRSWKMYVIALAEVDKGIARQHIKFLTDKAGNGFGKFELELLSVATLIAEDKMEEAKRKLADIGKRIDGSKLDSAEKVLLGDSVASMYGKAGDEEKLQAVIEKVIRRAIKDRKKISNWKLIAEQLAGLYRRLAFSYEKTGDIGKALVALRQVTKYIDKMPEVRKTILDVATKKGLKDDISQLKKKLTLIGQCGDWFGGPRSVPRLF